MNRIDRQNHAGLLHQNWQLAFILLVFIKGAKAIRRDTRFSMRSVLACGGGGFSVLVCLLTLLGSLLPQRVPAESLLLSAQGKYQMPQPVQAVCHVIILLILFTAHEYAHAFAAWKLGDETAKDSGRLTLNPLAHLDLFGSVILPGLLIWRQSDVIFGWAKPVPVNTGKFADPLRNHRIVAFAGPATNLAMAMGSFLLLAAIFFLLRLFSPEAFSDKLASPFEAAMLAGVGGAPWHLAVITFLKQFMYTSLALGFFNLLPIPPLDGGWIFPSLLPERARLRFETIRPYSFVIFLLLVLSHLTDYLLAIPLVAAWGGLNLVCRTLGFS